MRKLVIPKYYGRPSIGLALFGCTNRPFYHICVFPDRALGRRYESNIIEQVGTFDPLPNSNNEKLIAFNFGRLKYWIGERNAHISVPVLELLGISGLFPIHPKTFIRAKENQQNLLNSKKEPVVEDTESEKQNVCYSNVDIRGKTSNSTPVFKILHSSGECIERYNYYDTDLHSGYENCPSGLISVDFSPIASPHTAETLPHVQLNISIMSHFETSAIFVRLQCIHAPDSEDVYCHDSSRMLVNGIWRWPCRGVILQSETETPFVFGYSCFRLYGLSQYFINVTVFPQKCRETFLLTAPSETQLFPSIAKFYSQKGIESFKWSPVLFVDLTETDGIWFRVSYPKNLTVRSVTIAVFDTSAKDGPFAKKIDSYELTFPTTGVKWLNAIQGNYSVYAYVQRHDCSLLCNLSDSSCTTCVHTHLNFTLPEDIASVSWKGLRTIRDTGIGVIFLVLAVCLILVVAVSSILYARRRLIRPAITDLELNELKKVHIVYSDDSDEHSNVVMEFTNLLESSNSTSVAIDQRDLSVSIRPIVWLADSLKKADVVLIIVSPLTEELLNGNELQSKRPYPDLFCSSYELISTECSRVLGARRRFATVTLPYSGSIPREIQALNLKSFEVPSQIADLLIFIQNYSQNGRNPLLVEGSSSMLAPLNSAIDSMQQMMKNNPTWKLQRIISEDNENKDAGNIALQNKKSHINEEEQALLCEELDLLPPDDSEPEPEPTTFELLARDSSTDSDD